FMNPLTFGEYPRTMKKNVGSRLPFFTSRESNLVKGSIDFLGVNFYNTFYIKDNPGSLQKKNRDHMADMAAEIKRMIISIYINNIKILMVYDEYLTLSGQQTRRNSSLDDWSRVKYMHEYIGSVLDML
ncbi:hypothetical protein RYX36_009399, partial [Vicia faba]